MILTNELSKLIVQKYNRLYFLEHHEKILKRTSIYNGANRDLCKSRQREWIAREFALKMKGLCHICYCSNIEIYNHHGQILCNSCLQDYIKENPDEVYSKV